MNKNLLKSFAGLGIAMLVLGSCKKNNLVVEQDPLVTPPGFAKFNTAAAADTSMVYYVKSTNDPVKIPVGVTNVSGSDRTVNFTYESNSAVQGTQYNGPASLVIPAGKVIDTLTFTGLFTGYPLSSRIDTVMVTISGGDITPSPYKKRFRIILRKYCDVNINDFLGDYTMSTDRQGTGAQTAPYTASIASIVSTGPTSATAVIYNFGDPMFGDPFNPGDLAITPGITVNLDWANPANFKVTMPSPGQAISESYYGPTGLLTAAAGGVTGTFSSCDNTFTIIYNFAIGATNYGSFTTVLRR